MQAQGQLRAIGVSNFTVAHLQDLAVHSRVTPAVNQVSPHLLPVTHEVNQQ